MNPPPPAAQSAVNQCYLFRFLIQGNKINFVPLMHQIQWKMDTLQQVICNEIKPSTLL